MMGAPDGGAPSAAMRAYRVVGRVQGVGFREWTRRSAELLGLSGSVRNRPDTRRGKIGSRAAKSGGGLAVVSVTGTSEQVSAGYT